MTVTFTVLFLVACGAISDAASVYTTEITGHGDVLGQRELRLEGGADQVDREVSSPSRTVLMRAESDPDSVEGASRIRGKHHLAKADSDALALGGVAFPALERKTHPSASETMRHHDGLGDSTSFFEAHNLAEIEGESDAEDFGEESESPRRQLPAPVHRRRLGKSSSGAKKTTTTTTVTTTTESETSFDDTLMGAKEANTTKENTTNTSNTTEENTSTMNSTTAAPVEEKDNSGILIAVVVGAWAAACVVAGVGGYTYHTLEQQKKAATAKPQQAVHAPTGHAISEAPIPDMVITLEKADESQKLGFEFEILEGDRFALTAVTEGLMATWNANKPDEAVHAGDIIVDCNGKANSEEIITECKTNSKLQFTVRKGQGSRHAPPPAAAPPPAGEAPPPEEDKGILGNLGLA